MNGPRYIQRNVYMLRNKEREYEQHMKKLGMIESRKPTLPVEDEKPLTEELVKRKANLMRFQASEKYFNINRDNQVLLEKLVEISQGKWSSVTTKDMQMTLSGGAKPTPKTLNARFKKREAQRIAQENQAMAHRLVDSHPIISHKRLEKDYQKILEAKKVMVRMTSSPKLTSTKSSLKLPPVKTGLDFKPGKKKKNSKSMQKTINSMDDNNNAEEVEDQATLNDREPGGDLGSSVEISSPAKARKEEKKPTQKSEGPAKENEEEPKKTATPVPTLNVNLVQTEQEQPPQSQVQAEPLKEEDKELASPEKKPADPAAENQQEKANTNGGRTSGRHETAGPGQTKKDDSFNNKSLMKSITLLPNKKNANEPLQKSPTALQDKSDILPNPPKSDEKTSEKAPPNENPNPNPEEKKEEPAPVEEPKPEAKPEELVQPAA